jgi:hypothetical protein
MKDYIILGTVIDNLQGNVCITNLTEVCISIADFKLANGSLWNGRGLIWREDAVDQYRQYA